jgi:uncharacterized protein YodC (DUF2158 family)
MQKGDAVTLKHGGQGMTVQDVRKGKVVCVWIYRGKVERARFDPAMLKVMARRAAAFTLEDFVRAAGGAPDDDAKHEEDA